ncbi:MAG: hypothetical protein ABJN40_06015 [Sneathiella sp.]
MAYVFVEDFKSGLDRRKEQVNGTPGSLWELINAHITRGGAIERRKKFVVSHALPPGTHGCHAIDGELYVFGSDPDPGMPEGVTYQQCVHPDNSTQMSKVLMSESFDGKIYVIARFIDGNIYHYLNGVIVDDWIAGIVRADMADNDGIAEHLRGLIDAHEDYSATRSGSEITITGATNTEFDIEVETTNVEGGIDDQTLVISETQAPISDVTEILATSSFAVTAGTVGMDNDVISITVDGVEVLGADVPWTVSNSGTAVNIAAQINNHASSPEYTAEASGSSVVISAAATTGDSPNGFVVTVTTTGDVVVSAPTAMADGVNGATGQPQINTVTVGGTFEIGDSFDILLGNKHFGYIGNPSSIGETAQTFKTKIYSVVDSLLHFCGINDPKVWNRDNDDNPGAGFINMASQDEGSERLYGTGVYQGSLAVFARQAIQIWSVDSDDAFNVFLQVIKNTGTKSRRGITSYGNNDLFYLAESGIRSIRARDSSNAAFVSDVGTPIDPMVTRYMDTLTDTQIEDAFAVLEPIDDRYWLSLGSRIFVFSYFPGAKISAWSYYDTTDDIGGDVSEFARIDKKIYARTGDNIYLYGGADGQTYPDDNEIEGVVELPFLTAGTPGTVKNVEGFDAALTGTWDVVLQVDPNNTNAVVNVGTIGKTTYPADRAGVEVSTTHFAPKLTCNKAGPATLSNLIVHYEDPNEAG